MYLHAATENDRLPDGVVKVPTMLPKALRGWANFHTARAITPPDTLSRFEADWEKLCFNGAASLTYSDRFSQEVSNKIICIVAGDLPSFLFVQCSLIQ